MKQVAAIFILSVLYSCTIQAQEKNSKLINQELLAVSDQITQLLSKYLYNPNELETDTYLDLEKKVENLAKTSLTKQEFAREFNQLWQQGPFSHVALSLSDITASQMAEYLDKMHVGDQSVSLEWIETTAILTVHTMMGVDTKERVFEAYRKLSERETESLIIDLRTNKGGTFAGIPLVGHVLTESIDAGIFVSRKWWENNTKAPGLEDVEELTPWQGWSLKSFWKDIQEVPLTRIQFSPMEPHFNGNVYVLISKESASATEFTVDALANEKNVTIIGETTAGEMLSQKMFDLPHGFQLSLPIAEYYSSRIGRIEGKGVNPDIAIDQSVAMDLAISLINGVKLEDALKDAKQRVNKLND